MQIAYLLGRYPALSNTFILREVQALRSRGVGVSTLSMRRARAEHLLSPADREEAQSTYAVLPPRPLHFLAAHAAALRSHPGRWLGTLATALLLSPAGLRGKLWQLFYFVESIVVWDRCRRAGARHLHAHFGNVAPDVALLAAHFGGPGWTWSFTMHGPVEFYDVSRHRLRQKVERADLVVCISHFARSQLMALSDPTHWAKLRVVHCGVDVGDFSPNGRRPIASSDLSVLAVGRLVGHKGYGMLLEALARVPRARAVIVGAGEDDARIKAEAKQLGVANRVRFTGAVGQHEIPRYYAEADVFCLPSFSEGIPVVLMEAMATGVPVVTTRIMGIPELVEDGVSGLLVAPGDSNELVGALERLAGDPELRERLATAAREKVTTEFELTTTVSLLEALFRELLDDRGAGA